MATLFIPCILNLVAGDLTSEGLIVFDFMVQNCQRLVFLFPELFEHMLGWFVSPDVLRSDSWWGGGRAAFFGGIFRSRWILERICQSGVFSRRVFVCLRLVGSFFFVGWLVVTRGL